MIFDTARTLRVALPLLLAGAALLVAMIRWSYRSKRRSEAVMALAYAITFAFAQLDFARLGGAGAFEGVYLMVYSSAAMAAVVGATLVGLLASSLETSRRLTATLDHEVALRTADLEQANARLSELSMTDGLTGIANRRQFDEALDAEWKRARREGRAVSLLMIDVDHFKHYNDALGHLAGDDCLKRVAQALREHAARPGDLFARYGGEEFAVIARNTDAGGASMLAERLRRAIEAEPFIFEKQPIKVTISVGIATLADDNLDTPQAMVAHSDACLYKSKEGGRNRVTADPYVRSE